MTKSSKAYRAIDAVPPDPIAEEVTAQDAFDGFWMSLDEVQKLPIVHAGDMRSVGMQELYYLELYGCVGYQVTRSSGHVRPVYAAAYPVMIWPSDGGWYRVMGLEHRYPEILNAVIAQENLAAMIPGGKVH